ncbi:unnamed protein product, partial [Discosporangium mesarthrocarpum]
KGREEGDDGYTPGSFVGDYDEDHGMEGGQGDGEEKEDGGFPVCLASVSLHTVTNLLSFPGFAVDEEALDWDDQYTPIPEMYYGIREASFIWAAGVAVTSENVQEGGVLLDINRIECLRLLMVMLSLPLFCPPHSPE